MRAVESQRAEYLVHTYADAILRIGHTWLGDMDDAKDICQTVLIGLLEDGDIIDIDMDRYTISARISDEEFARRRERQVMPEAWVKGGWLARYQHLVSSADEGAILRDRF